MTKKPLPPGSTIGILGAGQLGRMTALAAANLGYRCHMLDKESGLCAKLISAFTTTADFLDEKALIEFAKSVDVVTFEFENIPLDTLHTLKKYVAVYPSPNVLKVCQDRLLEKEFCRSLKIPTAPYAAIDSEKDLRNAMKKIGVPAILKTRRFGYDGKGQIFIRKEADAIAAFKKLGGKNLILEGYVDFTKEVSVIVARDQKGNIALYPTVENKHKNHVLSETIAPAKLPRGTALRAQQVAKKLAKKFKLVGLLAVEMFVDKKGNVLVNEMAPRPHNSGHWTMDACMTSQFEQLVRIVAGLPLGATKQLRPAVMYNLLGDDINQLGKWLNNANAKIHVYDKGDPKPGRKMGHVTVVK